MSKLNEISEWIAKPENDGIGNKAITILFDCDEALVRKARHKAEIAVLRAENTALILRLLEVEKVLAVAESRLGSTNKARKPRATKTENYPLFDYAAYNRIHNEDITCTS